MMILQYSTVTKHSEHIRTTVNRRNRRTQNRDERKK